MPELDDDYRQAVRPLIRSLFAVMIYAGVENATFENSYTVADEFLTQMEKDIAAANQE